MAKPDILKGLSQQQLIEIISRQQADYESLHGCVQKFVDNNYKGGSKSDRADYVVLVSAKDIWELKQAVQEPRKQQKNK